MISTSICGTMHVLLACLEVEQKHVVCCEGIGELHVSIWLFCVVNGQTSNMREFKREIVSTSLRPQHVSSQLAPHIFMLDGGFHLHNRGSLYSVC